MSAELRIHTGVIVQHLVRHNETLLLKCRLEPTLNEQKQVCLCSTIFFIKIGFIVLQFVVLCALYLLSFSVNNNKSKPLKLNFIVLYYTSLTINHILFFDSEFGLRSSLFNNCLSRKFDEFVSIVLSVIVNYLHNNNNN